MALGRRPLALLLALVLAVGATRAATGAGAEAAALLARFFPPPPVSTAPANLPLPPLPAVERPAVAPAAHNEGVDLNNQGLAALERGDIPGAAASFRAAVARDPGEVAFRHNLALALDRGGREPAAALEEYRRLMTLAADRPGDLARAAFGAGRVLQFQLKRPREALPYFERALAADPGFMAAGVGALGEAWYRAGHPDRAVAVLRQHAARLPTDDPYPLYLLGSLLSEQGDFPEALRALTTAAAQDHEGYAREALLRTRFFAGQLEGLATACAEVLATCRDLPNRKSLEHLHRVLTAQTYRVSELVDLSFNRPRDITRLFLLLRPIGDVPGHQTATLEGARLESGGQAVALPAGERDEQGRLRLTLPAERFAPRLQVRVVWRVAVEPWLASRGRFHPAGEPDLAQLRQDPRLCLEHPVLSALVERLRKEPGNYLQNAFKMVGRGLAYRENFQDHDLAWAFLHPDETDCTEFALLLTALCLRNDIPARVVGGLLVKDEMLGRLSEIGHAWCEVWFPGKGWIAVDPTLGRTMDWAYFGNLLADQIVFSTDPEQARSRVSIDYLASDGGAQVKLKSAFLIEQL